MFDLLDLLQAIKCSFVVDDNFTLGEMLALGLHRHADACAEVVDCALKELAIEKVRSTHTHYFYVLLSFYMSLLYSVVLVGYW